MTSIFSKIRRMIDLLERSQEGLSLTKMAQTLKVDVRTIKRYLAEIRKSGYDVHDLREGANRQSLYHITDWRTPPEHFVPSLHKLKREMDSWGNPKYAGFIGQVIRYISFLERPGSQERLRAGNLFGPETDVYHVDHGPFSQETVPAGLLNKLESAVRNHQKLKITYAHYKDGKKGFIFYPYSLSLRVGTLYVIGRWVRNSGLFKSLSVKRIKRCESTSAKFVPSRFNIEEYYKYCFGQFPRQAGERPSFVQLRIREPWLEGYLREAHFNPPGKLISRKGNVYFEIQMVIKPDFVNWVMSLYPYMVPVRPKVLVNKVSERISLDLI
ncbi:helix-turn-helix transcriptional regulator [Fibrobacterota bacterium]